MSSSVDVLAWWMPRLGGDALVWRWMPRRGGDALVWRWMPGRGGECSGVVTRQGAWGATLLAPLWQSCVGVGVVPHHVAGGVVLCRIAMLARSASSASCGSCSPGAALCESLGACSLRALLPVGPVLRVVSVWPVWGARSRAGPVLTVWGSCVAVHRGVCGNHGAK